MARTKYHKEDVYSRLVKDSKRRKIVKSLNVISQHHQKLRSRSRPNTFSSPKRKVGSRSLFPDSPNVWEKLYTKGMHSMHRRDSDSKKWKMQMHLRTQQNMSFNFSPKINRLTRKMVKSNQKNMKAKKVEDKLILWGKKSQSKRSHAMKLKLLKESDECTFSPKLVSAQKYSPKKFGSTK